MPGWLLLTVCSGVLVGALVLTYLFRRHALERNLLDIPNERSSHVVPTPRGGGIGIVVAFLGGSAVLFWQGALERNHFIAVGGGLALVALIGFVDDHYTLRARWRFLVHLLASIWAVSWLGGVAPLHLMGSTYVQWGLAGHVLGVIGIVWLLNLYNFMDGIDGIAGSEAIIVAVMEVLVSARTVADLGAAPNGGSLVLAAASAGFLLLNWPPAKIFMGDVGSGALGFYFGALAVVDIRRKRFWRTMILLGCFIVDAMVTLLRRMARGETWYQAHHSHAYQHAARRWGHQRVTLAVCGINLFWLAPWAFCAGRLLPQMAAVLAALLPLVGVALALRAGRSEEI